MCLQYVQTIGKVAWGKDDFVPKRGDTLVFASGAV
jgi:hypothetical protein